MEFTVKSRRHNIKWFMKNFKALYEKVDKHGNHKYTDSENMFTKKKLGQGAEGTIYLASFKKPPFQSDKVIIKIVDLPSIKNNKAVSSLIINMTPDKLYKLFISGSAFNKPSLTEIICQTLTNQLALQNICPHYTLNYYWEYNDKKLFIFNEYANSQDFYTWASEKHSNVIWFNALFQIMVGLIAIKRYFGMIHSDFHMGNVLVHKIKAGGYWTYTIDNFRYHVPNLGYVFLIHDFGFAWIPNKLQIKWHFKDTLSHLTNIGKEYYDISVFIKTVTDPLFKAPIYFKRQMKTLFHYSELNYLFTKRYRLQKAREVNKSNASEQYKKSYTQKVKDYPNIDRSYTGTGVTLEEKLYSIFYDSRILEHTNEFEMKYINYSKDHSNTSKIDSYSLDKHFDKSKLPKHFRSLVED